MIESSAYDTFTLFVYGSLKRGFPNHEAFCEGAVRVEEARVRGWLYHLPFGFPAIVVPPESIHATGTADPASDVLTQQRHEPDLQRTSGGPLVTGEIFTFENPHHRLPELDRLEGFNPGSRSLYHRVLVPATAEGGPLLAWAYAIEAPAGTHLPDGHWPGP